jgi:putative tricarboxylic transport membrane protein
MRKFGFPVAPMVLAAVVTQMMETSLGQSMLMSQGSILILFKRPISAVFMSLAFLSIARGFWIQMRTKAPEVAIEETD